MCMNQPESVNLEAGTDGQSKAACTAESEFCLPKSIRKKYDPQGPAEPLTSLLSVAIIILVALLWWEPFTLTKQKCFYIEKNPIVVHPCCLLPIRNVLNISIQYVVFHLAC